MSRAQMKRLNRRASVLLTVTLALFGTSYSLAFFARLQYHRMDMCKQILSSFAPPNRVNAAEEPSIVEIRQSANENMRQAKWLMWSGATLSALSAGLAFRSAVAYVRAHRRVGRVRRGLCLHCGYSLQGLTEPRCPECGMPFAASDVVA
jgi:hypothetical protein